MNGPVVRFSQDNGAPFPDWKMTKLGDLFYRVNERNDGTFDKTKWISVARMFYQDPDKVTSNNIDTRTYVMRFGDIAFEGHPNKEFEYGRFVVNDIGDGVISELFPIYRHVQKDYVNNYWKYAIQIENVMAPIYRQAIMISGNSSNKLNESDFLRQSIMVPCIEEQKKIANFLSLYDQKIENQMAKVEALETRRKGLLQQIFSQEIRFKADDGSEFPDWDSVIIEDAFDSISDKNHPDKTVLTIIQGQGTIPRDESDRNISYNKASIPTYKLVKENDFIMHLRSFEGGLEIATREGIVSPAYTILRNKVELVPEFYRYYFRSSSFIVEKLTGITEGIRDGRSINMDDFWLLEIPYPSIPEQRKIGQFMDLINRQIQIEKDKLEAIKLVKKGLLQQMFV